MVMFALGGVIGRSSHRLSVSHLYNGHTRSGAIHCTPNAGENTYNVSIRPVVANITHYVDIPIGCLWETFCRHHTRPCKNWW